MNYTKLALDISLVDNSHIGNLLSVFFLMYKCNSLLVPAISFHHMNWNSVYPS